LRQFLLGLFCIAFATACTTQEVVEDKKASLSKVNALSISNQPLILTNETTFSWQKPVMLRGDEQTEFADKLPAIRKAIEQKFIREGYQFAPLTDESEYGLVAYVLVEGHDAAESGKSTEHKELLFGLDPGMRAKGDYGMGTLLVGIKDAKTGALMWRGAAQILTDPSLTDDERKARLENVLNVLFKTAFTGE
jgi:hypothetical protein